MRVFVTGASGWIGSAVVAELLANGHQALGLARSEASAEAVAAAGAEVVRGEVTDLGVLHDAAAECDAVVHLAFRHDIAFSGDFDTAVASNQAAIETIGEALAGSDKAFAIASGLAGLRHGRIATEHDRPEPTPGPGGRVRNELTALEFAKRGVRSMSVRFAPTVHGAGDHGFIGLIVAADREHGAAAYVGDGQNRWPAVHVTDAARLVRLGIERAPAGSVLHAAADEGVEFREIAEAIGRRLQVPAASLSTEEVADQHFGFLGRFVAMDMPASSAHTRELLDWEPTGPGLIADIDAGAYDLAPVA
jgi:nucleoside-diphosphate-sugar epimerase